MLIAQTPKPLEGAPVWLNAVLIGVPTTLGALTALVYALRGTRSTRKKETDVTDPPPPSPAAATATAATTVLPVSTIPSTVDGQLELAKMLVGEIDRDRADLRLELDATNRKLTAALDEVEQLKMRLADQAGLIAQLRLVVDRLTPGGPARPPLG